jgi:AraC-like DNA-binding protein
MKTFEGWDTGEIQIPEHLLYFVAENRFVAVVNGKRVVAVAGTLIWVSPNTTYRFYHIEGEKPPIIYRFRFSLSDDLSYQLDWKARLLSKAWLLLDWLKQIAQESTRPTAHSDTRLKNLISLLSIEVLTMTSRTEKAGRSLSVVQRNEIEELLHKKLHEHLQPVDLARSLGFTPDYFSRIFRRTYGEAPRTWILKQKLLRAAALLRESSASISQIAHLLGYEELYLFSRQFQKQFGMAPRRWRESEI